MIFKRQDILIAAGIGVVALGAHSLRTYRTPNEDNAILKQYNRVAAHHTMARTIVGVQSLGMEDQAWLIASTLNNILNLSEKQNVTSTEKSAVVYRLCSEVRQQVEDAVAEARRAKDDDTQIKCSDFLQDVEAAFHDMLESISYNAMLDAAESRATFVRNVE